VTNAFLLNYLPSNFKSASSDKSLRRWQTSANKTTSPDITISKSLSSNLLRLIKVVKTQLVHVAYNENFCFKKLNSLKHLVMTTYCGCITQLKQQTSKRRYYLAAHRRVVSVLTSNSVRLKVCCVSSNVGGPQKSRLLVSIDGSERNRL